VEHGVAVLQRCGDGGGLAGEGVGRPGAQHLVFECGGAAVGQPASIVIIECAFMNNALLQLLK